MPKIAYRPQRFNKSTAAILANANSIVEDYARRGYSLTLRQLYYQLVQSNAIVNSEKSYKALGELISNGRYAGVIDWNSITDRSRKRYGSEGYDSPADYMAYIGQGYRSEKWSDQGYYVETWIEKEALLDVLSRPANETEVSYFACKGYVSSTVIFETAMRLIGKQREGKQVVIIHLGDHDPSGTHMTKDVFDRISEMMEKHGYDAPTVDRIALEMAQIEDQDMPPQPAKTWDSRFEWYFDKYGTRGSWELDAAKPEFIHQLVLDSVKKYRDEELWSDAVRKQEDDRKVLLALENNWYDIAEYIEENFVSDSDIQRDLEEE